MQTPALVLTGLALIAAACLTPAQSKTAHPGGEPEPGAATGTASAVLGAAHSEGGPKMMIFLLLGQSNMEGAPKPDPQDRTENRRVLVLAYDNCPALGRVY